MGRYGCRDMDMAMAVVMAAGVDAGRRYVMMYYLL